VGKRTLPAAHAALPFQSRARSAFQRSKPVPRGLGQYRAYGTKNPLTPLKSAACAALKRQRCVRGSERIALWRY